jgi:hypothetical protein
MAHAKVLKKQSEMHKVKLVSREIALNRRKVMRQKSQRGDAVAQHTKVFSVRACVGFFLVAAQNQVLHRLCSSKFTLGA